MPHGNRSSHPRPRVTLVELNEFNPAFVEVASAKLGLGNLQEMLSMQHCSTTTEDRVEHQGLDPWVQWVNVHTGLPSSQHGVKRLGDTQGRPNPFWVEMARHGVTWGAWGVMNTPQGGPDGCEYFFPDPWSHHEDAYPANLRNILRLPRYVSKNYLDLDAGKVALEGTALVAGLSRPSHWGPSFRFSRRFLTEVLRERRLNLHTLTTFTDYLGFCFFQTLNRRSDPQFRVIFLNLIAHLQHQFWHDGDEIDPEMELGLRLADEMIGRLIEEREPGDALIIMNGLRQKNVSGEGVTVYRQNNPVKILEWVGAAPTRVEQCMTHDAHAYFETSEAADNAERLLDTCTLSDGTKAFFVERASPTQIFYQIAFEHRTDPSTELRLNNRSVPLSELISVYAVRTGAHVPEGDIYARGITLPAHMANHEISGHIRCFLDA